MSSIAEWFARAAECCQSGRLAEAEALLRKILQAQPAQFDALLLLGVVKAQRGDHGEAIRLIRKAIAGNPSSPFAHLSLGDVLHDSKQLAAALASYDHALALAPDNPDAHNNRANVLRDLNRREEALASFDLALKFAPGFVEASNNRGNLLAEMGRHAAAIDSYDRALAAAPAHPLAWFGRGNALSNLHRHAEAVAAFERAIAVRPDSAEAWYNRGNSLRALGRHEPALASYERAIALRPGYPEACNNSGLVLMELDRAADAVTCYDRALALRRNFADAHYNRGLALRRLQRFEAALPSFEQALRHDPDHAEAAAMAVDTRRHLCQWDRFERDRDDLRHRVAAGQPVPPFITLHSFDDPELHLRAARGWIAKQTVAPFADPPKPGPYRHPRLRIAYVSADFRAHPVAYHLAPLIELHDRSRFEVVGISLARSDASPVRARLEAAFDRFVEVTARTDRDIAMVMRELEIDIAVDLMGHTAEAHCMIFAQRAAPIQVGYLGYPGTTGAAFIDYIITDQTIMRPGDEAFFTEQPVCMPDVYQVNAPGATRPDAACTRAALGLPERGVVLCCLNQPYKITPDIFAIWMRLLRQVAGSCLWLYVGDPIARRNLLGAAERHGVAPDRLIFADPVEHDRHLSRMGHADLFLDTFPYGAHSTASDALRAGVPIVTCAGRAFQTRVCESLLRSIGVAELVTDSLIDYEALALRLAGDPGRLGAIKATILASLGVSALFDAQRFCTSIEAAFIRISGSG
jgi:predicted O-linked N-acetylglucosamine transferase (SPINDLY family)